MLRAVESARSALRQVLGSRLVVAGPDRAEALARDETALTTHASVALLGGDLSLIPVADPVLPVFEGFLDGIQRSVALAYVDGIPLMHGTAAAAIRTRDETRRMRTWRSPLVEHAVFASRSSLGVQAFAATARQLAVCGQALEDTDDVNGAPGSDDESGARHPSALLRQALSLLSKRRDSLERRIGQDWCSTHAERPLYVDGSLRTSAAMQRAAGAVGVVKSHARLYVPPAHLTSVLTLAPQSRTSVIAVLDDAGVPLFHTWYLRLRRAADRDPFFGLIRVETGVRSDSVQAVEAHADQVSQWLLAERAPVAKPDARWDVMPYAIRDCEVYLRAVA